MELLPGSYTLEIVVLRQAESATQKRKVEFQLLVEYLQVAVSRQSFLQPDLNFYGLLGYE